MFNYLSEKTGNLASTVWQNANMATAKAALGTVAETAGAVAGGIGSSIYKQAAVMIERNQKLKEAFACYHMEENGKVYHGTIHFIRNELFFSCEGPLPLPLPQHMKNKKGDLPILPHGEKSWKDNYERRGFVWGIQLTLNWGDIKEINTGGNTENSSERYIEITTYEGYRYIFKGFLNHQKAFTHLYSLLELSS